MPPCVLNVGDVEVNRRLLQEACDELRLWGQAEHDEERYRRIERRMIGVERLASELDPLPFFKMKKRMDNKYVVPDATSVAKMSYKVSVVIEDLIMADCLRNSRGMHVVIMQALNMTLPHSLGKMIKDVVETAPHNDLPYNQTLINAMIG